MDIHADKARLRDAIAAIDGEIEAALGVLDFFFKVENEIDPETGEGVRTLMLKVRVPLVDYFGED